jgi:NADPH2:quinone reductase
VILRTVAVVHFGFSEHCEQSSETLLVLGAAGGTGTAAIKIAKMIGAHVIAAASTEEKRSLACAEGADLSIDYTDEKWREALKSLTNNRPIDVIFDTVGGDISPAAFRTLGWRGRHLVVGFAAGESHRCNSISPF